MGVYLLVIAGATAAVADAAAACPTWPTCHGSPLAALTDPGLAVAWGHRLLALAVGVGALVSGAAALLGPTTRRVKVALAVPLVLYPVQVGLGAMTVTAGTPALLSGAHLAVGVTIFSGLVLSLAWTLEAATATPGDYRPLDPDPSPPGRDGSAPIDPADPDGATGSPPANSPAAESSPADSLAAESPADSLATESPPDATPETPTGLARVKARATAYLRLTKPRLMWLLCLVAVAAMALAAGPTLDPGTVAATLAGGVLAIGASGTFNHVLERDIDRRMQRTSDRPLVTDQVGVRRATAFGLVLAAGSMAAFLSINPLAAVLGLSAIVFYSVVYTLLLKPNTVQNTVVGGAAGALPALIGWAAVTGRVELPGVLLAGVIFLWTPAHFYNLALAYKEDYARGGFPMLPVVRGEAVTRRHVLLYFGATLTAAALLAAVTDLGLLYAATSGLAGAAFLWAVVRLHRERTERAALRSFHASNAYLGAVLLAVVVDAAVV
ncbi:protoheme IX farnesyltransferase [Halobacteriales archaeon QS_8_69_26]|nr:MAG: protoheme IX farnesyltransferase [Halobacteriales archaeon QS_8_69_26]